MEKTATEADAQAIATGEEQVVIPAADDIEAQVKALEAEKAKLIEESANYKMAYLKERRKQKDEEDADEPDSDERMTRIAQKALADSNLARIAFEQDALIKKALRENKELKLAQLNRTGMPPAAAGSHTESQAVRDTLVTPEQMAAFKSRGWTDKDIERYKANLRKYGTR